jgi:hypothetical protein
MLVLRMADTSIRETRDSICISHNSRRVMRFQGTLRRVAAGRGFFSPEGHRSVLSVTRQLLDNWQFAAAASEYNRAIALGHVSFAAELSWMLMWGRSGVTQDKQAAFRIAQAGARLRCPHSCGVLALCWACGSGCTKDCARALQLARESAAADSKFGQYALARLLFDGGALAAADDSRAAGFFRMAAAQNLDAAQWALGFLHDHGLGVVQSCSEALMWFRLAASQGMPWACASVAQAYEHGRGVGANKAHAVVWYQRAVAAGHFAVLPALRSLRRYLT